MRAASKADAVRSRKLVAPETYNAPLCNVDARLLPSASMKCDSPLRLSWSASVVLIRSVVVCELADFSTPAGRCEIPNEGVIDFVVRFMNATSLPVLRSRFTLGLAVRSFPAGYRSRCQARGTCGGPVFEFVGDHVGVDAWSRLLLHVYSWAFKRSRQMTNRPEHTITATPIAAWASMMSEKIR